MSNTTFNSVLLTATALIVLSLAGTPAARAQSGPPTNCGSLQNAYGPFDYRTEKASIAKVEQFHFTMEVEQLVRGKSGYLGGDLDYTLRASPNHHRALLAMSKYGERLKTVRVPGANYDVECYFVRATRFRPDDATALMLYAVYLKGQKRVSESVKQLDVAADLAKDNPFTHYNLGLSYFDLNEFPKARKFARSALALGFPRTELRDRLIAAGRWDEPAGSAAAPAASEPSASAVAQ
jgi:tetratricopeptide (TPR) repeat protein